MKKTAFVLLASVIVLTLILITGCWEAPNDYWSDVDTETETETILADGGECFEDDTDNCGDGGA